MPPHFMYELLHSCFLSGSLLACLALRKSRGVSKKRNIARFGTSRCRSNGAIAALYCENCGQFQVKGQRGKNDLGD